MILIQRYRPVPYCDSKAHVYSRSSIASASAGTRVHPHSVYRIQHPSTSVISHSDIGPAPHSDIKYTSTVGLPSLQYLGGTTPYCLCACCSSSVSHLSLIQRLSASKAHAAYPRWQLVQHISSCCSQHIRIGSSCNTSAPAAHTTFT